jgi:hypothetical protein
MNDSKQIDITGRSNRYKIKKLTCGIDHNKKRLVTGQWTFSEEYYNIENQLSLLKDIKENSECASMHELILLQLDKKIAGYKHQDILKKKYDAEKLIKTTEVVDKLISCELKCFYCKNDIHVLYKVVREMQQWTLDRINNDMGHVSDNVEISCLECNLKRKKQNSEKFLFTKQMKIVRNDFHLCEIPLLGNVEPKMKIDL